MDTDFDVAVIGGGVVGCATLFELTNQGYKCVLVEKNKNVLSEASSGNSGMLHTGFDAPLRSKELHCIKQCQDKIFPLLSNLGIPYEQNGAIMAAWSDADKSRLNSIHDAAIEKGIQDCHVISGSDVYQKEPNLHSGAIGGLWFPKETIVDPFLFPLNLLHHSIESKSLLKTDCEVWGYEQPYQNSCLLRTSSGPIKTKAVVNCSGLYGDIVDEMADCKSFSIKPRKGQYTVYSQDAASLINSSILPVPTDISKGQIVFKTVYGNVVVGPTAEDVESRVTPPVLTTDSRRKLRVQALRTVPRLTTFDAIGEYTGLRPATQYKDYQIKTYVDRNWVSVGGIRSTGLSGCLGISSLVGDRIREVLSVEPTYQAQTAVDKQVCVFTSQRTVLIGNKEYSITHPITQFGIQKKARL